MIYKGRSSVEKEWEAFLIRERRILSQYGVPRESFWKKRLSALVPEGLSQKLEAAFIKAFEIVLANGTGLIEKTYARERMELEFQAREYRTSLMPTRKNIRENSKRARRQTACSAAAAGVEGAGLGILGISLPDIPLFLASLLRSLYTLCIQYGIDYDRPEEKKLLLEMIELSLYQGADFEKRDAALNRELYELAERDRKRISDKGKKGAVPLEKTVEREKNRVSGIVPKDTVRQAAKALSDELLYLKFLQGIAVVGVIGGALNSSCLRRIDRYASLKLERRYLLTRIKLDS